MLTNVVTQQEHTHRHSPWQQLHHSLLTCHSWKQTAACWVWEESSHRVLDVNLLPRYKQDLTHL